MSKISNQYMIFFIRTLLPDFGNSPKESDLCKILVIPKREMVNFMNKYILCKSGLIISLTWIVLRTRSSNNSKQFNSN